MVSPWSKSLWMNYSHPFNFYFLRWCILSISKTKSHEHLRPYSLFFKWEWFGLECFHGIMSLFNLTNNFVFDFNLKNKVAFKVCNYIRPKCLVSPIIHCKYMVKRTKYDFSWNKVWHFFCNCNRNKTEIT
jgi:hypothetical protein